MAPEIPWLHPLDDWPDDVLEHRNVVAQLPGGQVVRGRLRKDEVGWVVQPVSGAGTRLAACARWRLT